MSEIKYGLISNIDAQCIEATLNYICNDFNDKYINVTEVGCYGGDTGSGVCEYLFSKHRLPIITGIDSNRDGERVRFRYDRFIQGNSNEFYNKLEDNSQHLILIDANHSLPYVIADYYCYKNKLKVGGYLCFHDTAPQAQGRDWQRVGDENDKDMSISVRKALKEVGLLPKQDLPKSVYYWNSGWQRVFDEFDPNDEAGGVCIFKKTRNELWD